MDKEDRPENNKASTSQNGCKDLEEKHVVAEEALPEDHSHQIHQIHQIHQMEEGHSSRDVIMDVEERPESTRYEGCKVPEDEEVPADNSQIHQSDEGPASRGREEEIDRRENDEVFADQSGCEDLEEAAIVDEALPADKSHQMHHLEESLRVREKEEAAWSKKWTGFVLKLHKPIKAFLKALAGVSARNPKRCIAMISFLSVTLIVVGLFTNFKLETDEDALWTPFGSRSANQQKWIEEDAGFPEDDRGFRILIHADGEDILGRDSLSLAFEAFDAVKDLPDYDRICSESDYIGADGTTTCQVEGVVRFFNYSSSIFESEVTSDQEAIEAISASNYPDGVPAFEDAIMGYSERDENNTLTSALSYMVRILLPPNDASISFELKALDAVLAMADDREDKKDNILKLEVAADRSFTDEVERAVVGDIPFVGIVFVLMALFSMAIFWKRDKVHSRSFLGLGAVVCVLLSLMSGFGLLFTIGVELSSITQILPFVIFGIGLDDAFVIMGAYQRKSNIKDPVCRIEETIEDVGVSITLTTMTSALAFGLGCLSRVPTVYWLCLYAFPTILIDFLYQVTFFVACIVLDERRIQQRRRDCCICITVDVDTDEEIGVKDSPQEEHIADRFMAWYGERLLRPWVKAVVILGFAALTGSAAYSLTKLEQDFQFSDVLPSDSYATDFNDALNDYFEQKLFTYTYFRFVDQSDENIQIQMEEYVNKLLTLDSVTSLPDYFWLEDFKKFVNETGIENDEFDEQMEEFLADPVYADLYSDHIVRDESRKVTASRVRINNNNVDFGSPFKGQVKILADVHELTGDQPINAGEDDWPFFTYDRLFNFWEWFASSGEELRLTAFLGVASVTVVAFFFIPHWTAALFLCPMITVLYVDLLGVMQWAGLHIDPVSYFTTVMSIGLFVDFIMHVLLRYYEVSGSRRQRTIEMLRTMGASVLLGGLSTLIGTLALAFCSSTVFRTIFIAFMGLVTLGISHGLILLPVLLSLLGPEDVATKRTSLLDREDTVSMGSNSSAVEPVTERNTISQPDREDTRSVNSSSVAVESGASRELLPSTELPPTESLEKDAPSKDQAQLYDPNARRITHELGWGTIGQHVTAFVAMAVLFVWRR